jgi:23S rRNA U2552 (ribose-2'-O)-methylase RlmE/FtsJ
LNRNQGCIKFFYGALITAIGISSNGSSYIFKFFSFNDKKTIELLQIASLFYEKVDIVRTLTTKSASGENYCVCLNYNYTGDKEDVLKN